MKDLIPDQEFSPFKSPKRAFGGLDADKAAGLLMAAADIALVIGPDGSVIDLACTHSELLADGVEDWRGQAWSETATIESQPKIESLLQDARKGAVPRWRQLNHHMSEGPDLPITYAALDLGKEGLVLVFGRELRTVASLQQQVVEAQQAMEREYMRLRHTETRYRVLFQMASESVLIVDAANRRIVDANPAAIHLLRATAGELIGQKFPDDFESEDREAIVDLFASARSASQAGTESAQMRLGDQIYRVSVSLFRQGNNAHLLVRLASRDEGQGLGVPKTRSKLLDVIETMPDGFVVTDLDGRIVTANPAFLDLAQLATEDQARGQSLGRWLGRLEIDLGVLTSNLREHGVVRLFVTTVQGELGSKEEVEVSGVSVINAEEPCLGFSIRSIGSRQFKEEAGRHPLPKSVEQLTELVGHVSLKDLVRETTDMIERLSIEAALELSGDNRASAAELLGLSRQSLYAKLHRYGLGDLQPDNNNERRG